MSKMSRQNRADDPSRIGNSKYAKKLARKRGRGRIDPGWQWWFFRGTPEEAAICAPSSIRAAKEAATEDRAA